MSVTQGELGRRLKAARDNCGLTQQQVAEAIGVTRTAVVQMEAGNRAVNSLEIGRLARMYGRAVEEFLEDEPFLEDPVIALFRATPGLEPQLKLNEELRRCVSLCRELKRLEELLQLDACRGLPVTYALEPPEDRWDAICQGRYLAEQERHRLDLGSAPIGEIADVIARQGVRVTEYSMPSDISGLFFHRRDVGLVIVINHRHPWNRRRFSYAHEYCHLLADRSRPGTVSREANRQELAEIRANAFAAHFLMPERGVRGYLQALGKGEATRQEQEIFDEVKEVPAQRRMPAGSQEIQAHDAILLSHHYGVSYEAALYHLLNLKRITKDRLAALMEQKPALALLSRLSGAQIKEHVAPWTLRHQLILLALEAFHRGEISRGKLRELAMEADMQPEQIDVLLSQFGGDDESVDAIFPE